MFDVHLSPTLGGAEEWIMWAVFLGIAAISWIGNTIRAKQQKGSSDEAGSKTTSDAAPSTDAADPHRSGRSRLDGLAARRRTQLQQVKRQRQQATGRERIAPRSATSQPENLTVTQRQERDRAKASYEQRVANLRDQLQAQQQKQQQQQQSRPQPQQTRPTGLQRPTRQPTGRKTLRRRTATTGTPPTATTQVRRGPPQPQPPQPIEQSKEQRQPAPQHQAVAEIVDQQLLPSSRPRLRAGRRIAKMLNRRSLRDAIVLKEILDRPLALREE